MRRVREEELLAGCVRSLFHDSGGRVCVKGADGRYVRVSEGWAAACTPGRPPSHAVGRTGSELLGILQARVDHEVEVRVMSTGTAVVDRLVAETWQDRADTWAVTTTLPLRDASGDVVGTLGLSRDVTTQVLVEREAARKASELSIVHTELRLAEEELRSTLEISPDAIARYDDDLRYVYLNPAAARLIAVARREALGRTDRELGRSAEVLEPWESGLRQVLMTGRSSDVELTAGSGAGERWFQARLTPEMSADGVCGVLTSVRELTSLRRAEQALAHQALHDPVTGLANRLLLGDRLAQSLLRMQREPGRVAVLVIDLDRFKVVNDALGHAGGDQVLVQAAQRLATVSRRADTVARFGGDEFVILCDRLGPADDVRLVADRVVRALAQPFDVSGQAVTVSASVGVVVVSDPYVDAGAVLRDADAAMYQAKERGRNRFHVFDADQRGVTGGSHALEVELVQAIDRGELRLAYQPQVRLSDSRVVGAEALVRWEHPTRGLVPPGEFIGVAEDRGLIVAIGTWVLLEACRQLAQWRGSRTRPDDGCGVASDFVMAVNVSARQLREEGFPALVAQTLERYGLDPGQLCLEITETALIEEAAAATRSLETLSDTGVHIALDDFGTGYSSLAHLRSFPVDVLKIDKSFVDRLEDGAKERKIVAAVTAMAHVLDMTVVGEGIETPGQLAGLRELGCDEGQGYLLARPMPPEQVLELLQAREGLELAG